MAAALVFYKMNPNKVLANMRFGGLALTYLAFVNTSLNHYFTTDASEPTAVPFVFVSAGMLSYDVVIKSHYGRGIYWLHVQGCDHVQRVCIASKRNSILPRR